ncbi:MAG: ABC transporter substrate-binding protein [Actinobacteria bacterium]|nr:ABC transporter substrate-binding protein [Actinomycetota bacterium]
MRTRGRTQRWVLLLTALALFAAACGGGEAAEGGGDGTEAAAEGGGSEAAATGGEFSAYICEPEHLFPPANVTETCGAEVLNALYAPLVSLDLETSEAVWGDDAPHAVAANVETEDQQTWTITLKDGWTFHDGSPVTAQSYVDAWNFGAANPEYTGNYFFDFIEGKAELTEDSSSEAASPGEMSGVSVVDDLTFEVTLTEPFSQWPLVINYTAFYPMPQACLDDPSSCEEAPIGNGPFMMDGTWNHNQNVKVARYEDYAGEPANADGVDFRIYADVNTAYTDLQAGALDVMDNLPPEQIEAAQSEFGDAYLEGNSSSYTYVGFPIYDEKFADPQLRKAFSMAVDRQAITDAILPDQTPADAFVSPVVAGYREGACGEACTYNPEMAKQLFDEAGGYDGTLTLWFNSGAGHEEWMEAVSNQLRDNLGIQSIEFETLDFAQYLPKLESNEVTGPFRLGWVMDYPSPQNYLQNLLYSTAGGNYTRWENAEFDSLIDEGNQAESLEAGLESYAAAEDIAAEEVPHMPMFFGKVAAAHSQNVSGVEVDAQDFINVTEIEVVSQ